MLGDDCLDLDAACQCIGGMVEKEICPHINLSSIVGKSSLYKMVMWDWQSEA
jgi:hypothetical protein